MRIFMLGWEFPPYISGGLGTACYGLTRALNRLGHHITFVLPQAVDFAPESSHVQLKMPPLGMADTEYQTYLLSEMENVEVRAVSAQMRPYDRPDTPEQPGLVEQGSERVIETQAGPISIPNETPSVADSPTPVLGQTEPIGPGASHYHGDLFTEVHRYARIAMRMAMNEDFDVVHAHDWMTYPAGIAVAAVSGKPLVVHVHSTEFDRSGEHVNQRIYDIERQGMHCANKVIAVSHLTRNIVINRYGVPPEKIIVGYNAIDQNGEHAVLPPTIRRDEKIVLFLGRITMQKGPEYFLAAAKKVLEFEKNVRFIMAGSGDMIRRSIEMAAGMGIGHKVLFTGFLRGDDVARVFKMADLYVMPSVSEPFGIAPLEALSHDVPVLISKQSGVSEILTHVLKVDFWDIHEMANKIIAVLRHPPLQATLREHGNFEVRRLTWRESARGCLNVYVDAAAGVG